MSTITPTPLFDFVFITEYMGTENITGHLYMDGGVDTNNPKYILADGDVYTREQLLKGVQGGKAVFISSDQMGKILEFADEEGRIEPNK